MISAHFTRQVVTSIHTCNINTYVGKDQPTERTGGTDPEVSKKSNSRAHNRGGHGRRVSILRFSAPAYKAEICRLSGTWASRWQQLDSVLVGKHSIYNTEGDAECTRLHRRTPPPPAPAFSRPLLVVCSRRYHDTIGGLAHPRYSCLCRLISKSKPGCP